ncbi:MAG: hypothetical protein AB1508_13375 [Pseudomonadota bacterium]
MRIAILVFSLLAFAEPASARLNFPVFFCCMQRHYRHGGAVRHYHPHAATTGEEGR